MRLKLLVILVIVAMFVVSGCSTNNESETENQNELTGNIVVDDVEEGEKVVVYFFWGDGCPHCTAQKPFMEELKTKYPTLEIKMYETWKNPNNKQIFAEIAARYDTTPRGVPATFIGDELWVGFSASMKSDMENKIIECLETKCVSPNEK